MPKPLTEVAQSQYAALIASSGMTSRIRTLAKHVKDACQSPNALDWSEDLQALGISIPADEKERDAVRKALASSFGTVATEVSDGKRGARVSILDTGEVAVTFRTVKVRAK